MHPEQIWKEAAKRAATSAPVMGTALAALGASLALANPLPAILWAVGSAAYVLKASNSPKQHAKIMAEARDKELARLKEDRRRFRDRVWHLITTQPFATWVGRELPDYQGMLTGIEEMREQIVGIAHERREVEVSVEQEIAGNIDTLYTAFLRFLEARVMYVYIRAGVGQLTRAATPARSKLKSIFIRPENAEERDTILPTVDQYEEVPELDLDAQLHNTEQRQVRLRERFASGGSAAQQLETYIGVLEHRIGLLREIAERDERLAVQTEMLPDVFAFILDRVRAARFDASEITSYMSGVVEDVERTQQFVEQMRPMTDDLFREIDLASMTTAA